MKSRKSFDFYPSTYKRFAQQREQTASSKEGFKKSLLELFENGKIPEDLSLEDLANLFGLETQKVKDRRDLSKQVQNKIKTLFGIGTREAVKYLYDRWKEEYQTSDNK